MPETQLCWLLYLCFSLVRISPAVRRWRMPLVQGEAYFLGLRVPAGFYRDAGRTLLARYRIRVLLPYLLDVAGVPLILSLDRPRYLYALIFADVVVTIAAHWASVRAAHLSARAVGIAEPAPVSALIFPLTTRTMADYTDSRIELAILLINTACLAWLGYDYLTSPWNQAFIDTFHLPVRLLYLQLGLLLIKVGLVRRRTRAPREGAAQYLAWDEARRRLFLRTCDVLRIVASLMMISAAVRGYFGGEWASTGVVLADILLLAAWSVWYHRQSRTFLAIHARTTPVRLPATLEPGTQEPGILFYRPESPVSMLRTRHGYAFNLANRATQIAALYLGGLVVVWKVFA